MEKFHYFDIVDCSIFILILDFEPAHKCNMQINDSIVQLTCVDCFDPMEITLQAWGSFSNIFLFSAHALCIY